jgi:DNA modification methylase
MAKVLKTTRIRVTRKLAELNLQTKYAIDQQEFDSKISQMLSDGSGIIEVMLTLNVSRNRVKKVEHHIKVIDSCKPEPVKVDTEMDELIRNYQPDFEETGEYTYSELSDSEKIIYHSI